MVKENILKDVVVFDIETQLFSKSFLDAQRNGVDMFDYMPAPRVCVCYDALSDDYEIYLPDDFHLLYNKLLGRNILSFNGKNFDINVILKHLGKNKSDTLANKENHYDLLELVHIKQGKRYKLDDLVRVNLGERKHTDGRKMEEMHIEKLIEACRSDVRQTYRLMKRFLSEGLKYKRYREYNSYEDIDDGVIITKLNTPEAIRDFMEKQKKREKLLFVQEALINGHKYKESEKIKCLDDLLSERIGKTFLELTGDDGMSLSFTDRCEELIEILLYLGIKLPYSTLERNLTEGQIADMT